MFPATRLICGLWLLLVFLLTGSSAHAGSRVDAIRAQGYLRCGVTEHYPGFADQQADGSYRGLEADLCRAIAVAILGRAQVRFTPVQTVQDLLSDPGIDIVFHRLTWTLQREAPGQLEFGPVVLYDALGVLLDRKRYADDMQLAEQRVCVPVARRSEVQSFLARTQQAWTLVDVAESVSEARMLASNCAAWIGERTELAVRRSQFADPLRYGIGDTCFGKEPLAPLLHSDDVDFSRVVRWTFQALVEAEEHQVTRLAAAQGAGNWYDPGSGEALGLASTWADRVIAAVGNFGEIYERHLGPKALNLPRSINRLWTEGGLLYALPMHP